jgi:hypothetical protein
VQVWSLEQCKEAIEQAETFDPLAPSKKSKREAKHDSQPSTDPSSSKQPHASNHIACEEQSAPHSRQIPGSQNVSQAHVPPGGATGSKNSHHSSDCKNNANHEEGAKVDRSARPQDKKSDGVSSVSSSSQAAKGTHKDAAAPKKSADKGAKSAATDLSSSMAAAARESGGNQTGSGGNHRGNAGQERARDEERVCGEKDCAARVPRSLEFKRLDNLPPEGLQVGLYAVYVRNRQGDDGFILL